MPLTEQEQQNVLVNSGYDTNKYRVAEQADGSAHILPLVDAQPTGHVGMQQPGYGGNLVPTTASSSIPGAALRGAAMSALPAIGGGAAAGGLMAGLGALDLTPAAPVAIPLTILAGLGSAYAASKAQNAAMPLVLGQNNAQAIQQQLALDQQQHPYAQMLGGAAANVLGGLSPSLANVGNAAKDVGTLAAKYSGIAPDLENLSAVRLGNIANVGLGAGIQGGLAAAQGDSGKDALIQTVLGALFNKPNSIGTGMYGFHPTGNTGVETKRGTGEVSPEASKQVMDMLRQQREAKSLGTADVDPSMAQGFQTPMDKANFPSALTALQGVGQEHGITLNPTMDTLTSPDGTRLSGRAEMGTGQEGHLATFNPHIETAAHETGHDYLDRMLNEEGAASEASRVRYVNGELATADGGVVKPEDYTANQATAKRLLDSTKELMATDPEAKDFIAAQVKKGDLAITDPEEFLQQWTGRQFVKDNVVDGQYKPDRWEDVMAARRLNNGKASLEDVTRIYQNKMFRDPGYSSVPFKGVTVPTTPAQPVVEKEEAKEDEATPKGKTTKEQPADRDRLETAAKGIDTVQKYAAFKSGLDKRFGQGSDESGHFLRQTPLYAKSDDNFKGIIDPNGDVLNAQPLEQGNKNVTTHIPVAPKHTELPATEVVSAPPLTKPEPTRRPRGVEMEQATGRKPSKYLGPDADLANLPQSENLKKGQMDKAAYMDLKDKVAATRMAEHLAESTPNKNQKQYPDPMSLRAIRERGEVLQAELNKQQKFLYDKSRDYFQPADRKRIESSSTFKQWFGDSKAVDKEGNPLVVYHGTKNDFNSFDKLKSDKAALMGPGFYLSSSKDVTGGDSSYAYKGALRSSETLDDEHLIDTKKSFGDNLKDFKSEMTKGGENQDSLDGYHFIVSKDGRYIEAHNDLEGRPKVMSLHVSIKNPLNMDESMFKHKDLINRLSKKVGPYEIGYGAKDTLANHYNRTAKNNLNQIDERGRPFNTDVSLREFYRNATDYGYRDQIGSLREKLNKAIESEGYDGMKHTGGLARSRDNSHEVYIAFNPEQIKSAIGNRGTFDSNDPNILHQPQDRDKLDPNELRPALKRGKDGIVLPGEKGQIHAQLIHDNMMNGKLLGSMDNFEHGFVDSKGQYYNRDEAAKALGVSGPLHSQDLNEMQQGGMEHNQPADRDRLGVTIPGVRSAIDAERVKSSPELAAAHIKLLNDQQEYTGKLRNKPLELANKLTDEQKRRVLDVMNKERDSQEDWSGMLQTQPERNAYRAWRDALSEQFNIRTANDQPVKTSNGKFRKAKQDEWFAPSVMDKDVAQTIRKGNDTQAIEKYHQDWLDKAAEDKANDPDKYKNLTDEKVEEEWRELGQVVRGDLGNPSTAAGNEAYFNGIRKQEGRSLPESMREKDLSQVISNYARRSASDMAWYKNVESQPAIAAAHGYTHDGWGKPIDKDVLDANPSKMGNQATRDVVESYRGEAGHGFSSFDKTSHAAESAATMTMLGPATEVHKTLSSIASAVGVAKPSEVADVLRGITSYHDGWQKAIQAGSARVPTQTAKDNIRLMLDSYSTIAERLQGMAQSLRHIYTLGGFTDKFIPGFLHNAGEAIMSNRIALANAGDKEAAAFLHHYDPDYEQGKHYGPDELQQMAGRFANTIHGSRDARTLPSYMLEDTELSAFLKLAHWQISTTNSWMRNIYTPATKGNLVPLIMSSVGSVLGGYAIKEMREGLTNRKTPVPTWAELEASDANARQGLLGRKLEDNKRMLAYNLMELSSIAGFGGIMSSGLKMMMDVAARNAPSGMGTIFPLDELVDSTARIGSNIGSAIMNGDSDRMHVLSKGVSDWISQNVQTARVGMAALERAGVMPDEYAHKMDYTRKLQDLRRFKEAAGLPYEDQVAATDENPYMNLEAAQYKREPDLSKAMEELPPILHQLVGKYSDRPTILLAKLESLKKSNYETMPSMENDPLGFASYNRSLNMTEGQQAATDRLIDYLKQNAVNKIKEGVIP